MVILDHRPGVVSRSSHRHLDIEDFGTVGDLDLHLAVLDKGFGGVDILVCQVFQHFQAVGAIPADRAKGGGNVETHHACPRDSHPHSVLEDVAADLDTDLIVSDRPGLAFERFHGSRGCQSDRDRFRAS